ncbi:hypothetical protein ACFFRR_009976 [Megaselia abdita]
MWKYILPLIVVLALLEIQHVSGHGMLMEPVNRGSRWRLNNTAPKNYQDNGNYCGNIQSQHDKYDGKCGFCGDDYGLPAPRPHELGGTFGEGIIVNTYTTGQIIPIDVKISAPHRGYFIFHVCNLDLNGAESEECFDANPVKYDDGNLQHFPPNSGGNYYLKLQLPSDLFCHHCVLRWTWITGNRYGTCSDGTGALGCGPQQTFKGCSDIAIL